MAECMSHPQKKWYYSKKFILCIIALMGVSCSGNSVISIVYPGDLFLHESLIFAGIFFQK